MLFSVLVSTVFFFLASAPVLSENEDRVTCVFAESTVKFTGAVLAEANNWSMGSAYYRIELLANGKNYIIIGSMRDNYFLNPRVKKGMKCRRSGAYMSSLAGHKRVFGEIKDLSAIKSKGKARMRTIGGREIYSYTFEEEGLLTELFLVRSPDELPVYFKQSIPKLNMKSEIIYKNWDTGKKVNPGIFLPDAGYKLIEVDEKKFEESLKQLGDSLKPYIFY